MLTDGVNSYAWNAESETKTAQGVTYTYDGLGNRVEKSNGTLYWYGPGGEVLDETNLTGSLTNEYVFFAGKRVARRDASGNIYYYAEDFIGSSRVITQSNGTLCSDADFLPFGQGVDFTSTCGQNYKFEGKERDIETGNDNFGARYYRSALGRWMSPDWSAIPAPVPYANLTNPQTLNLYAMTSDNPETFADLDGHSVLAMIADPGNSLSPDMMVTGGDAFTDGTTTVITDGTPPPEPSQATGPVNSPAGAQAQQQSGNQLVVTPDKGAVHILPGGYEQAVDYKLDKMDAKGKVSPLSNKDASGHKVELTEKLVSGSGVEICHGQCVTHGTLTDIMQVGGGRSHSVIKRFEIDDRAARIYDPGTKKAYDFVRVDASSKNAKNPFVFTYGNDPQ